MGAYGFRLHRAPVDRVAVHVGDEVLFHAERCPFTARAVSSDGRWVICTRPVDDQDRAEVGEDGARTVPDDATVIYTVIDFDDGVRGTDNYGGLGYETEQEIADALAMFETGDAEVSVRYDVLLDIAAVRSRGAVAHEQPEVHR
jgi:hypothetical protein